MQVRHKFLKYCQISNYRFVAALAYFTFVEQFNNAVLKYCLLILLLICCHTLPAQILKGVVIDSKTHQPIFPVTVVNLTTQASTYTSEQGNFSIKAEAGDKVAFSYIGYKASQYQMPISVGEYRCTINLERTSYMLNEVILTPDYTPYQHDSIRRVKTYAVALSRQHSSPLTSPFSFVAEKFNKRSKQIFKFQKNFNKWETERFIDSRYTPELVQEMTQLSADSIGYFMNAYPMPYDYARAATDLELKMWIRDSYRKWKKGLDTATIPIVNDSLLKR